MSHITYIPPMSVLRVLGLSGNSFQFLPDLSNVSGSLEQLYIANNNIHAIDGIPQMTTLNILNLKNNNLTNFPDVRNAGGCLTYLILSGNDITTIPDDLIAPLVELKKLALGTSNGEPVTLPNVCTIGRNVDALTIDMYTEYITCGWEAVHTKLAEEAGRLLISPVGVPAVKCTSPTPLVDRIFSQVTIDELINATRKFRTQHYFFATFLAIFYKFEYYG